ncbi:MAG: phytanoyl-CoA dioxygenase family protein [Planctomycetes bacterium]|nr:phytanoyl-CoA dioxygenase family protein [Planctomycetota bacterium]
MVDAIAQGRRVPDELRGELVDSTSRLGRPQELRERLCGDGYVLLRGMVDRETILSAREEVFDRLVQIGEIKQPAIDGIATGESQRRALANDLGDFWRSVCSGPALRDATHGKQMEAVMTLLVGEPAQAHDFMFLRPGRPGVSTRLHYDLPFFARGSNRVYTAWLALGDIPLTDGPLMIAEGSNQFNDLIDPIRQIDYDSSESPTVQIMEDTVRFVQNRSARLLTSCFGLGDLIVFDMVTLHGTLDNCSDIGRVRLSCDVRWQPASDPIDPRYRGANPPGTTGAGYGELNGAKPLTDDWHTR